MFNTNILKGCLAICTVAGLAVSADAFAQASSQSAAKKGLVVCRTAGSQVFSLSKLIAEKLLEKGHTGFKVEVTTEFVEKDRPIEPVKFFDANSFVIKEQANICSTSKGVTTCKPCDVEKDGKACKLTAAVDLAEITAPPLTRCDVTRNYKIKTTLKGGRAIETTQDVVLPGVYINIGTPGKEVAKAK